MPSQARRIEESVVTLVRPTGKTCQTSEQAVGPIRLQWRGADTARTPGVRGLTPADAAIPPAYLEMSEEHLRQRIERARTALGTDLVILGHHYQREEIIRHADFRGDSYKLSQLAANRRDARYIVFCGVHFMAESADILSAPHQQVILPNLEAGCSMANMAQPDDVEACWAELTGTIDARIVPVTYMNSAASLKAFCGRNGGLVCTSSNASAALRWALDRGDKVLFFPDQHLGRNTALRLGYRQDDMLIWSPRVPSGGHTVEELRAATFYLWLGWCSVHARFSTEQIRWARENHPGVRVIVHPECKREVVDAADEYGSTELIARRITESAPGSVWAVGTEINLVSRLERENPDKTVFCLDPVICPCSTMYRIHPGYLAWVLDRLAEGEVVNRIAVDAETTKWAKVALERMLQIA
ncbi:MAG: quinolinate synthase NadA [Chloroflexi bacterium]|nr:quinolinate synthase NadA [Chloroflexota bacterium]